jgi:hypothetical protein
MRSPPRRYSRAMERRPYHPIRRRWKARYVAARIEVIMPMFIGSLSLPVYGLSGATVTVTAILGIFCVTLSRAHCVSVPVRQIVKFKRLLALSRQRLEENQKQLADKNQVCGSHTASQEHLFTLLQCPPCRDASLSVGHLPSMPCLTNTSHVSLQLIDRLGTELEAARARAHVPRASSPTNALPRRALLRIHEGST